MPNLATRISQTVFRGIHENNLIYNTCWEDPRCDRQLLDINAQSQIVMITSAGCNALDYALDNPAAIHCIDMNYRQNALLDIKIAAIQHSSHSDLFKLFGDGIHTEAPELYQAQLREYLPAYARRFWDKNLRFFNGKGIRRSFYYHGSTGLFAWLFTRYLNIQRSQKKQVQQLIDAQTIEEQRAIYFPLEPKLINGFVSWLMDRKLTMYLLGVPKSQIELFSESDGVMGFIRACLRKVFTEIPVKDNYFWRLYLNGRYTPQCCPNYLLPEYFETLQQNTKNIHTHTDTIAGFLERNPAPYTQYVLLDHQDWLAANDRPALEHEWRLILKNSAAGTRILLRSAAYSVDFFPDFVHQAVEWEQTETARTHALDRVSTYGSVYLGIVK
jgi:S-adenosylmethionine-diacylglycerol 3-amino-3-carboxypropyl transferase